MHTAAAPLSTLILIAIIGASLCAWYSSFCSVERLALNPWLVAEKKQYYRIISSAFVHADLWHLLFNAVTFYFFASPLERILGPVSFLIVFFGSQIIAQLPTIKKYRDRPNYSSLGASGAVSGIVFALILFDPWAILYVFFIPMPAILFAAGFIFYSKYMERRGADFINHSAHLWGALAGVVLTIICEPLALEIFVRKLFFAL